MSLVVIAYTQDVFVDHIEHGPFDALSRLLYKPNKAMKDIFSRDELRNLKPFDLYDTYEMDIEDVSGWDDDVFLKGKKDRVSFGACLYKLNENLDAFLEDDIDFYKENLLKLMREFDNLPKQIDYVTWYNL